MRVRIKPIRKRLGNQSNRVARRIAANQADSRGFKGEVVMFAFHLLRMTRGDHRPVSYPIDVSLSVTNPGALKKTAGK